MGPLSLFNRKNRVSEETREARLLICEGCQHKAGPICGKCGCVLTAKARVASESCPEGLWGSETPKHYPVVDKSDPED